MRRGLPGAEDLRQGLTLDRWHGGGISERTTGRLDWLGSRSPAPTAPTRRRAAGRCDFGRACVEDRRARRIDRFFAANPALAERLSGAPVFRGAGAGGRYCNVFRCRACWTIRNRTCAPSAAFRLPLAARSPMKSDPDRKVRVAVASG